MEIFELFSINDLCSQLDASVHLAFKEEAMCKKCTTHKRLDWNFRSFREPFMPTQRRFWLRVTLHVFFLSLKMSAWNHIEVSEAQSEMPSCPCCRRWPHYFFPTRWIWHISIYCKTSNILYKKKWAILRRILCNEDS